MDRLDNLDIGALRETLVHLGLTPSILAGIGCLSLITLFFSVRAVLHWYLGIQQVHEDLIMVRRQLSDLQLQLSQLHIRGGIGDETLAAAPVAEKAGKAVETFRLNH